ncbi:MAG: electron transfer flavoprotein subunit beta/FixA family protein, partial [Halanaeroarchaeum sp.]
MKVLVTVKEVAALEEDFEIEGTNVPEQYLEYDLNEWDDYAVEEAVQLREDGVADEVVTATIGPERAEETIRMALAKGADRAIRVWDEAVEGAGLLDVGVKTRIFERIVEEE